MSHLSTAQMAAIKADIASDPVLGQLPNNGDTAIQIAAAYNTPVSPTYWVYKRPIPTSDVGDAINATEIAGLTTLNLQRLQAICGDLSGGTLNPANKDRRDALASIFSGSGGTITRPALDLLWRRAATRYEKVLAVASTGGVGTRGSTANPDTLGTDRAGEPVESPVDSVEIYEARK